MVALIDSMTPQERRFPAVIKASRKIRIANGSGTSVQDLNRLLKQFLQMQKVMKKITKKGGLKNMLRGMAARLPRGVPPR
jgi:signal recognition particle subunit SRP54